MPEPVERWIEPEEVARRHRRRRGRWRALRHAVVLLLVILVVGGVGVVAGGAVLGRWDLPWAPDLADRRAAAEPSTAPLDCERALVTAASAQGTNVEVLNATTRSGLAGTVGDELTERGFSVVEVGNFSGTVTEPARVLFPEGAERAALAVAVHLEGSVLTPDTQVSVVTAVLGEGWTGLADLEAVAEAAQEPRPSVVSCAEPEPGTAATADAAATRTAERR
ncbi:LytR C-terminal domain-containing protein [Jannaschia sp. R86511]|uniref:LytR C-terminal domain-containing protein n=1 Tax=Jannaschia sp. R86511 TaxID=3093853 RepID=UPI0036D42875